MFSGKGRALFLVPLATLILLAPALLNGFPFVATDSSRYFGDFNELYASPFYGWTIYLFHWNSFIWAVPAFQCLILAHLIYVTMRVAVGIAGGLAYVAVIAFLTVFSSLPFFGSLLMADVFTGVVILCMYLLAFRLQELSTVERVYFTVLAAVGIAAHLSNLTIALASTFVAAVLLALRGAPLRVGAPRIALLLSPAVAVAIAFNIQNYSAHKIWAVSPAGSVFLFSHMLEAGPARTYLKASCPAAGYRLCSDLDSLPKSSDEFLWHDGIYKGKYGGFAGFRDEASAIVAGTVRSEPLDVLRMVVKSTASAAFHFDPVSEIAYFRVNGSNWFDESEKKLLERLQPFGPTAEAQWFHSRQRAGEIPYSTIRTTQKIILPLICLAGLAAFVVAYRKRDYDVVDFLTFVAMGSAVNIIICAVASGVYDRYQARVSWILVFAVITSAIKLWQERSEQRHVARVTAPSYVRDAEPARL